MNATDYLNAALRTENTPHFVRALQSDGDERSAIAHRMARLLHGMIGLCTETGELQDAIKKNLIYGKHLDVTNIVEEVGDVTWYLAIILSACGSSFEEAFAKNIAKLKARFPDKFTEELALNRDLDAERAALEGKST